MKIVDNKGHGYMRDEGGWALLGVLLALSVIGIMMLQVVPKAQTQVRREKEAELIYRGGQMAQAIARYYQVRGQLAPINPFVFPRGPLVDLKILRNGIALGTFEIKLLRPSALIEPISNGDWEPVRIYDPRISKAIQTYAAYNKVAIPPSVLQLAGQPLKLDFPASGDIPQSGGSGSGGLGGSNPRNPDDPNDPNDPNDVDDPDPSQRFGPDSSNWPIVGVAPKLKGQSIKALWGGLTDYSEWVFIYIPDIPLQPNTLQNPGGGLNVPPPPPPPPPFRPR